MKCMRFWASRIVLILLLASVLLTPLLVRMDVVQATPETVVEVKPPTTSANVGEQIIVNVTVVDVQNLYGVDVTLYWNSSVLEAVQVDVRLGESDSALYKPLIVAVNNLTQEQGKYVLAVASATPAPPFNGSGNVFRITFNVTGLGDSKLDLEETQLWDHPPPDRWPPVSYLIEHVTIDGFVSVVPEFLGLMILPLFVVLTVFAVVLSRRVRTRFISVGGKVTE